MRHTRWPSFYARHEDCNRLYCAPAAATQKEPTRKAAQTGRNAMTELTRRQLLAGAAAASAAFTPFAATPVRAAAPVAGRQVPSFYRYRVGELECTSISDGARTFPMPDGFVRNVAKEQALAAAEAAYMPKGMVTVPFNPQLINTGSKLILIDCGNGVSALEPTKGAAGRTLQNL